MAMDADMGAVTDLLRRQQNALLGKYRATVSDNADPRRMGRLRLDIPSVFPGQTTDWVPGAFALGGNAQETAFWVPATGSHVLVEFIEGDRSSPIWTAAYFPQDASAAAPHEDFDLDQGTLHLLRSRSGLALRMEDDGESHQVLVLVHPSGAELRIDDKGIVTLTDKAGASLTLDPEAKVTRLQGHGDGALTLEDDATTMSHGGVRLVLSAQGVTIDAPKVALDGDQVTLGRNATSPILNAQAFSSFFDAHAHGTPAGPSTPPAPPSASALAGMTLLSVKGA